MRISDWSSDVCSSDLPTLKPAITDLHYTVPSGLMAPGNGKLVRKVDKNGWTTWNWHARSIPTYGTVLAVCPRPVMRGASERQLAHTLPPGCSSPPGAEQRPAERSPYFPRTAPVWQDGLGSAP